MIAPTHRFSPFDRQSNLPAVDRNAPGRSAPRPAGRTPHVHGEQHDDATSQETVSAVSGRLVSHTDARRMAPAVPVADDLGALARRLERGARDAGRVAGNLDILAARLSVPVGLCESYSHQGLTYAVNEHAEHAQLLADAHAVVVRMAAFPEILDVLSALEKGAEVIVRTDVGHASPSNVSGDRSARTDAVGGEHYPTSRPRKLWSGLIETIAGHRKSSTPAHLSAPSAAMTNHRTGDFQSAGKGFQRSGNDRAR